LEGEKMKGKFILYGLLILSWASLFKLDKYTFKRYLPAGTFTALIYTLLGGVNDNLKWWKVTKPILPKLPPNFPFAFGPFVFLPIWILKFTFGRLWLYLITNIVSGLLFAYPITSLFGKLGIYKMKKMTRIQLFFLSISSAILLYIYQLFIDETQKASLEQEQDHI
jgi:uncharacterized membrane protein YeaQ/YmgE (transglycosylase-associated protein family)